MLRGFASNITHLSRLSGLPAEMAIDVDKPARLSFSCSLDLLLISRYQRRQLAVYFDRGWEMAQSILDFQTLEKIDMKMLIQLLKF